MGNYDWDSAFKSGEFRHWEDNHSSQELATLIAAGLLRKKQNVLDVGCGGGTDTIFLAKSGLNTIGVDSSRKALKIAKRRAKSAHVKTDWVLARVFNLPIKTETIDLATDRGLFHVIEDADRPNYASELFRVLKRLGSLLIRGASKNSARDRFNPITAEAISRFFDEKKFEIGPVVPIQLFSKVGSIDGRIVLLKKIV